MTAREVTKELSSLADPTQAVVSQRYFKTGPGEYGAGDVFIGVTVPLQRKVAKQYRDLPLAEVENLLKSKIHEHRLVALLILDLQYQRADEKAKKTIVDFYLRHLEYVNNWDLVDSSAPYILGAYLLTRSRKMLYRMARSQHLWTRRVAILATYAFIKHGEFQDTLAIAELLLKDTHDLIHKAVGWMLREVGNKDKAMLIAFLDKQSTSMPRTMLRYAIEKLSPSERRQYTR